MNGGRGGFVLVALHLRCLSSKSRAQSNTVAVAGSSFLWAWGFLCYLSPVLFPDATGVESVGLEVGFFVSQVFIALAACVLFAFRPLRRLAAHRVALTASAVISSLATIVLAGCVSSGFVAGIVACGAVHGVCIPLLGSAWGARYSMGPRDMRPLVVVSFLVAYILYFAVSELPCGWGAACTAAMPFASWALWRIDACSRSAFRRKADSSSDDVWADEGSMPSRELFDGSWSLSGMPWRVLVAVLLAALVGNMVASAAMGFSYENAEGFFEGGAFVCACIATIALAPLALGGPSLSSKTIYKMTLTFTAMGLVGMLIPEFVSVSLCGALVLGCAFFFQVLVIVSVSRVTWEKALSPLLSFCFAQALIAVVVLIGNMAGKQISVLEMSFPGVFELTCGISVLALFLLLMRQVTEDNAFNEACTRDKAAAVVDGDAVGTGDAPRYSGRGVCDKVAMNKGIEPCECSLGLSDKSKESDGHGFSSDDAKAAMFAASFGLTKRESEVFSYLSKGRSLPYIADKLFVTTGTVKTHTTHIYRKLGVKSKQELLDLFDGWR